MAEKITVWATPDGATFKNEIDAAAHERKCVALESLANLAAQVVAVYKEKSYTMERLCRDCGMDVGGFLAWIWLNRTELIAILSEHGEHEHGDDGFAAKYRLRAGAYDTGDDTSLQDPEE